MIQKMSIPRTLEVHDGTGTVIGVEKGESDGLVIGQLNFGRGVEGKSFLGFSSARGVYERIYKRHTSKSLLPV
jgi:hypothetical protein